MSNRYFTGAGVDTDTKKAMELWESAAEKGDTEALYLLGLCHTGIGAGEGENVQTSRIITLSVFRCTCCLHLHRYSCHPYVVV
jgi:TPR repeat protein